MRDDQFQKLQVLSEKLTDVLFDEIDPETWPAAGKKPVDYTKDERGDRYWTKKNAAATLTLITRVQVLTGMILRAGDGAAPSGETAPAETEVDMDKEVSTLEKQASKMLDEVERQRRKREFDARTLGKHGAH